MRIRKLDLYVLFEVVGPFLGGVLFFSFVFLMFQALRLADFFIIHGAPASLVLQMSGLMILSFLPVALPIAFLIGVLVAFGRLSSDSELVAMKANGISVVRLSIPVIALSLVAAVLSLALNMEWVPWGEREFKKTLIRVSNTKVTGSIKEGTFTTDFFNLLIYVDKHDAKTNRLQKVFIFDEREPKNPLAVVAKEGELLPVRTESKFSTAVMMRLFNGNIHANKVEENEYQKVDFKEYKLYLKVDEGSDNATVKPRMIPYRELVENIDKNPEHTGPGIEFRTEYWRRLAVALSPLVFVFLGIGYGTVRTRAVRAGAALVALIVILIYWSVQAASAVAAQKGIFPPVFAMQLPNIVIALFAVHAFRTANW